MEKNTVIVLKHDPDLKSIPYDVQVWQRLTWDLSRWHYCYSWGMYEKLSSAEYEAEECSYRYDGDGDFLFITADDMQASFDAGTMFDLLEKFA